MKRRNKKQKESKKQAEAKIVAKEVFSGSKIRFILFLICIIFLSFFLALISSATLFSFIALLLLFWIFYSIRICDRRLSLILKKIYSKEIKSEIKEEQNRKNAFLELKKIKNRMLKGKKVSENELKSFIQKHFKDHEF
jgi:hypothetical protein